jgi:hypothetical protein
LEERATQAASDGFMGMYDDIECEYDLPDGGDNPEDRRFQTKSLYRALDCFTITKEGRLILRSRHQARSPETEDCIATGPMGAGDRDMNFHGDIRLVRNREGEYAAFVVRFTHGQLEWIKPMEEFPEEQQALIRARNLEEG